MNNQDRGEIDLLKKEVKEMHKSIENLITNHIPHIMERLGSLSGALKVLIPLVILLLALIAGLYFM